MPEGWEKGNRRSCFCRPSPPSICSVAPRTYAAAGDNKNATAADTSLSVPGRPAGSSTARAHSTDAPARERDAPFQRGDWVKAGRDMGQVVQVKGESDRLRIVIEDARTLQRRTIDPRKRPVRRLDG